MENKAVAYYRVSTDRQGRSGLGLNAQRSAVEKFCTERGFQLVFPPYQEIESGKRNDRPELLKAIQRCRQTGASLVIAKLDRLSRNAVFLLTLQDSGVRFVAADMDANEFTVGIMALVAQQEREAISSRTKAALSAARDRGTRLGNPRGAAAFGGISGSALGGEAVKRLANEHAELLRPVVDRLRGEGPVSLAALSRRLNEEGMRTPRGGRWHASSVRNLLSRLDNSEPI
jgi:DNA invertase Pin-like site-specific DNA recombinase